MKHAKKLIVVTGGPGAGKTAALEIARKYFGDRIAIVPEAASIIFNGGFPRSASLGTIKAAQRAIYFVQRELEAAVSFETQASVIVCDRGSLDGLAYWPGSEVDFFAELSTTPKAEMARYEEVIHMRTPSLKQGYNRSNPARIESAEEALTIDEAIAQAWRHHPKRHFVQSSDGFIEKVAKVISIIERELAKKEKL